VETVSAVAFSVPILSTKHDLRIAVHDSVHASSTSLPAPRALKHIQQCSRRAMQAARPLIGFPLDDLPEEKEEPPPRSETTPPPAPRGGAPAAPAPTPPSGVCLLADRWIDRGSSNNKSCPPELAALLLECTVSLVFNPKPL